MSKTIISVERVNEVNHHPDADRLDVVQVLGYQVITGRDNFKVGDSAIYFPPDMLIPNSIAVDLGVDTYLKHAVYPGDIGKSQCRVGACRLRGLPSHGFLIPTPDWAADMEFGTDVTNDFCGKKYEPPVRQGCGDVERESGNFPQYTSIENIQRYGDRIEEGTEVVITEKIHGTNVRMGYVQDDTPEGPVWNFAAGSHKVRRKEGSGLYWKFMTEEIKHLLMELHNISLGASIIVYGEIFGTGIQDLDYGLDTPGLRVFDISVDGKYMDFAMLVLACEAHDVEIVPELYRGPYSKEIVEEYTYGKSTFKGTKSKFKDREGCVVKPMVESLDYRGNRVILKSVSADYRNRKGAKDIE